MVNCAFGECHNTPNKTPPDITFIAFPKPKKDLARAKRWAYLCGRGSAFTEKNVTKNTYICSKHFVLAPGESTSWKINPTLEPVSARSTRQPSVARKRTAREVNVHEEEEIPLTRERVVKTFTRKTLKATPATMTFVPPTAAASSSIDAPVFNDPASNSVRNVLHRLQGDENDLSGGRGQRGSGRVGGNNDGAFSGRGRDSNDGAGGHSRRGSTGGGLEEEDGENYEEEKEFGLEQDYFVLQGIDTQEKRQRKEEKGVQADINEKADRKELREEISSLRKKLQALEGAKLPEFCSRLKSSDKEMLFQTGLNNAQFSCLWQMLGPAKTQLYLWDGSDGPPTRQCTSIAPEHQLILTLVRLRQGVSAQYLSYQFKLSYDLVRNLFITWIQFLYLTFDGLRSAMYCTRDKHQPLPKAFKNSLLNRTRIVLDCTEILMQNALNFEEQGNNYSHYKGHSTGKTLLGVAPCGACMFCSDVYEGSISDKEIVAKSGVLDYILPGDQVVVDRGFTIRDEVAQKGGELVIPSFLGKRSHFTKEETVETKLIARARIHVERFNDRIKKFKIISGVVPRYLCPLLSQIVFILCCLVNFKEEMVK